MGCPHTHVDKNSGGMSWEGRVPYPHQAPSARKISPYHFWQRKPVGIELVEKAAGALSRSSWGTHTQTHLLRLAPSELQHQGGNLKGTSGVQGETEVSGIKESRGHCPFAEPSPTQSQWAGAISESLSTWLTLCDLPWRSTGLSHPNYGPSQASFP